MQKFSQAIVMGGSLGGLLTARALSNHFEHVTILERDIVSNHPESRKGQAQTRHLHGLLASGLDVITGYFPDLPEALVASGALMKDFGETMHWYTYGGYRKKFTMGILATIASRPLLEHLIRQRVLALPNVTLRDNCAVQDVLKASNPERVTGVVVADRGNQLAHEELSAELVVDCTGRGSRTPQWLGEWGFEPPPTSEVKVDVGYATRLFKRDPNDPRGDYWYLITPEAPQENRFAGIFPIEGDRWIASIGGWHGDHAPTEEAAFMEFAQKMPASDVYDIMNSSEPISDIIPYKFTHSLRRHYEKLRQFPEGFLVLGDAISSFNPTYGQGMSSAALQTQTLDNLLANRTSLDGLAPAFFKKAARVVDIPWQLAVGEDFRFPQTSGPKLPGTDLINRYVAKVHRATQDDEVVGKAFLKVMNLMSPPPSLFHPRILFRVLRKRTPATNYQQPTFIPISGD